MDPRSASPISELDALPTLDEYLSSVMADRPAKKVKFEVPAGATVVEIDSDDDDAELGEAPIAPVSYTHLTLPTKA